MRSRKVIERMLKQGLPEIGRPVALCENAQDIADRLNGKTPKQAIIVGEPIGWCDPAALIEMPTPEMVARIVAERMGIKK